MSGGIKEFGERIVGEFKMSRRQKKQAKILTDIQDDYTPGQYFHVVDREKEDFNIPEKVSYWDIQFPDGEDE